MIRKIRRDECLPRYDRMNAKERRAYLKQVSTWLDYEKDRLMLLAERPMAKAQNIIQLSARLSQEDCMAFHNGAILLSAHTGLTDTWLPTQLYFYAASRAVKRMAEILEKVQGDKVQGDKVQGNKVQGNKVQGNKVQGDKVQGTKANGNGNRNGNRNGNGKTSNLKPSTIAPVRPRHIDQYVHLLPQATQEKASRYRELRREIDEAREKLRLLTNDTNASAASREQWAKHIIKLDNQVGSINRELDREWAKLVKQGKVVVDDLGMAHVVPEAVQDGQSDKGQGDKVQDAKPEAKSKDSRNGKSQTSKQTERKEYLKKWLRDTRYGTKETKGKEWEKNLKELLKLGGKVTPSIRKAAEHYGVDIESLTER